jgi:hypothetical protein
MEFEVLLPRVALALGIGLLIGLERGWRTPRPSLAAVPPAFGRSRSLVCLAA